MEILWNVTTELSSPRQTSAWRCRDRVITLGERTLIMGVLNVTPDSFSDGGRFHAPGEAVACALELVEAGADMLDIGGVSTRPGASTVPLEEELRRVVPVVEELAKRCDVPLSVDTVSLEVAQRSLETGAHILNDVSGLREEPRLADLAAQWKAGLILMHSRGTPETMQSLAVYDDLLGEVCDELLTSIDLSLCRGVSREQLVLDPGIGFAKTAEQNLELLRRMSRLLELGYPLLLGTSRKSFIGHVTGRDVGGRLAGTAASVAVGILGGASVVRVHDICEIRDVADIVDAVLQSG